MHVNIVNPTIIITVSMIAITTTTPTTIPMTPAVDNEVEPELLTIKQINSIKY